MENTPQVRRHIGTTGFSLRDSLIFNQGVTLEDDVKMHLNRAYEMIKEFPSLRVSQYRVNSI